MTIFDIIAIFILGYFSLITWANIKTSGNVPPGVTMLPNASMSLSTTETRFTRNESNVPV